MSEQRRAAVDINRLIPRSEDPPAEPDAILIYVRPVDGILRTCARYPDGRVTIIL